MLGFVTLLLVVKGFVLRLTGLRVEKTSRRDTARRSWMDPDCFGGSLLQRRLYAAMMYDSRPHTSKCLAGWLARTEMGCPRRAYSEEIERSVR